MEIVYSHIDDDWCNSDESIEEVATCAFEDLTDNEVNTMTELTLFKGLKKKQEFKDYLNVDSFLEQISESAYDNSGDYAEDYLCHVSVEQKQELESLICSWAEKNKLSPTWFMVEEVKEVKFTIPQEWKDENNNILLK